jgi:FkbM family methyltransferase
MGYIKKRNFRVGIGGNMARIFMSIRMIIERTVSKILRLAPFAKYIEFSIRSNNIYKRMFGKVKFLGDHFQDLFAYMYLEKKQNGFYIDIGANDGVTASNTCVFEQLGWRGVCVEPQPEIYRQLRKSRNCDCYNAAVSSKSDDCVEFVIAGDHGVNPCSGLADGFTASLRKNINEMRLKTKTIKVKTMTFDDVMKNYPDVTHIDYMSIDVEGAEADILETIDFEKYSFGFVTIEGNEPEKITALMEKRNYEKLVKIGLDIVFVPRRVGGGG